MKFLINILVKISCKNVFVLVLIASTFITTPVKSQNYEAQSIAYNSLIGGVSGGIGAIINKHQGQKWYKAFAKGFVVGVGGGGIMYAGKKMNSLIALNQNISYSYLSRFVFDAGNSIVENASANKNFWSRWHYDVGFIRIEFDAEKLKVNPKIMASTFITSVFLATKGKFDLNTTLKSGIPTFYTNEIKYAPTLVGSTLTNGFLFVDSLRTNKIFFDTYAHEAIHTFQFQEFSGLNYWFNPITDKWKVKSKNFTKISKWIYGDVNYEYMIINYFLIQGGVKKGSYCKNFLENEAEFLSTGRPACNQTHP